MVDRKDIETLIGHLEIAGVRLWEEGGQLHFRAPAGALPVEARATLAESREEVISILRRRPRFAVGRSEDAGISAFPGDAGDNRDDRAVAQLMAELEKRRVVLSADGERLKISAPKGALTEDLKRQVISLKSAVIAALSRAPRQWAIPTRNLPPVADRSRPLPLSHMQQRLWFLKQLDPGNTAFSIPCAIRFRGNLLIDIVEKAFQFLVQRHESLRMRFSAQEGVPACHVDPCLGIRVFEKDLRDCSKDTVESELRSELAAHISVPFELANGPLWRVQLLRVSNEDCVLSLVFDHIIIDGISLGILLEEFRYTYTQLARGAAIELPELKAQYVDLVAIDRDRLQGEWLEQHLRFWKAELADLPEALQLPTDRPRPAVQTYRGAREERILIPGLPQRLRSVARELKLTPFVILLAAFQEMLHRYAGVDDLAVGTAVANRDSANSEGVVGFFANNVVLRGDLVGNPTVLEFLRKTRDRYVRCMDHQAMPFDLLVDTLVKRRNTDHSPLFQVMFVLQGWARPHVELPGAVGELVVLPTQTSRYDLAADVFESQEGIGIFFEYNTDLFDASTIRRMLHHYERLLQQMLERPEARLNDLDLLDAAEQHQLVTSWNDTATDYPRGRTLHELFQEQAKRTPEVIALVYEGESLSYAELNQRANRLAHHLHKLGVGARSLVGVFLERSIDMVVAVLGALKAGAAYVPLDPAFPRDRIDFMINDAALAVIVTTDGLAPTLEPGAHVLVRLDADAELIALASTGNLPATSRPMDLAYVIYTSGSTGRPKGVMIEHRAVVNFLSAMHRQPGITQGDRFVAVTTLSFDIAGLEIHGPLTTGATVVLAPRASVVDGVALAALLDHSEATILQATPSTWRLLLDSGWNGRQGLRMLCGGENLPRELAERLLRCGAELWNMYGPTETTVWSTLSRVTDTQRAISIGRPIANTQVYVLEPSGKPAPIGVAGELCIGGDGLARGYLGRDELTAEKFVTVELPGLGARRVYRTGDLVRVLDDGRLEFAGRLDHQVKVRGFRIELGEIESVLASLPGLRSSVVHVREDAPGDQRLVGYVVLAGDAVFEPEATRASLRSKLPEYMVPNQFVVLEALPLTPNGKVDRKALPAPGVTKADPDDAASDALMTPQQRAVADLWREVLGVDRVRVDANFFDMGGHSLLLVKLQASMQRKFGREVPLVELFQNTTVAAQAERLATPLASNSALQRARERAARQFQV